VIAGAAVAISYANYILAKQKRADDLFDRRFAFYKRLEGYWMSTGRWASKDTDPYPDIETLISFADEASFLFSDSICKHIVNLPTSGHRGSPFFPDDDFVKPFREYLRLERPTITTF
ncbi:MAG TPA: hypothetical protein VN419_08840, partial [Humidesulfovibrio sp.]|uniref:hypothetical protein n=1 Tax=Humidesulfovibrio sp. TaxID=2910988 RepID=UPI002BB9944B